MRAEETLHDIWNNEKTTMRDKRKESARLLKLLHKVSYTEQRTRLRNAYVGARKAERDKVKVCVRNRLLAEQACAREPDVPDLHNNAILQRNLHARAVHDNERYLRNLKTRIHREATKHADDYVLYLDSVVRAYLQQSYERMSG